MDKGRLYVLGTPIGNLEDLTLRGLRILGEVDAVIVEDTRVTDRLLSHYEIKKPMFVFHQHSASRELEKILALLQEGKNLALVTDAGTPGISDPGGKLIESLLRDLPGLEIIPLPGPNAAIAALSISGFPTDRFTFLGFPPHKKGRKTFFKELALMETVAVFYESTFRIIKALQEIDADPRATSRSLVVVREGTKKFETIYRGRAGDILKQLQTEGPRGEFTVVVGIQISRK